MRYYRAQLDTGEENRGELVKKEARIAAFETFGNASRQSLANTMSRLRKKLEKLGYMMSSVYVKGYIIRYAMLEIPKFLRTFFGVACVK